MSRSLHTQKLSLRAARRQARPYSTRRAEAAYLTGRTDDEVASDGSSKRLRIQAQKPLPGTLHPLRVRDIRELLTTLGPAASYGLRSMRLRQECVFLDGNLVFAEYVVPGDIVLYAVPKSPWRLPCIPSPEDRAAFARHGACVRVDTSRRQTTVEWTFSGLRAFYLAEVLAHELGHHRLQYHKGKRAALICRRRDHEQRAILHSRRIQQAVERIAAGE
jgi:hypothetical protein